MIDLGNIWRRHAATAGVLQKRPDFRLDPVFYAQQAAIPVDQAQAHRAASDLDLPGNFYTQLRRHAPQIDAVLTGLICDTELLEAIEAEVEGALELAFELIKLGAPVDERISDFSIQGYLDHYQDIAQAGVDPLGHYLLNGAAEGRRTISDVRRNQHAGKIPYAPDRPTCLIAVHEMSRTGAPIVGRDLAREAARTHNIIIAASCDGELLDDFRATACEVVVTSQPLQEFRFFRGEVFNRIDFAIINSVETFGFVPLLVAHDIPFAAYLHEYADYTFPAYKSTFIALFGDLLVFSSDHVRDSWAGRLADVEFNTTRDSTIIPQRPVLQEAVTAERMAEARRKLSAIVGRDLTQVRLVCGAGLLQWRKGTDIFVMASQIARQRDPDCVFLWIGDGLNAEELSFGAWMNYHLRQVGANNPAGNLFFLPAGPAYLDVIAGSDAMFLSSRLDPLPNVVFDAVRLGCQVVLFEGGSGFGDARYVDQGAFTAVDYANPAAAVDALLALPRKTATLEQPALEQDNLFQTLVDALHNRLATQDYFVRGESDFDLPVLFSTEDRHRPYRILEREKMLRYRRRMVWRDVDEARKALAVSDNWVHKTCRITHYATAERDGLPSFSVHIHAHYTDELAADLATRRVLQLARRIVVTTDTTRKAAEIESIAAAQGIRAETVVMPNRGRDILPFMNLFSSGGIAGEDEIWCHIHQKKSLTSAKGGDIWRRFLLRILLGEGDEISSALSLIGQPGTGLVAPFEPHYVSWARSRDLLPRLEGRLPGPLPENPLVFPVGNMFWTRASVVRAMNDLFGPDYLWPNEPIANDGTEYHLIERLWPAMAAQCELESVFVHKPDERRV
ncbi:rhamnan synthesis F family protein [Paracoccus sp. SY]|uniref:rhamnan synthesis F family protein n=1 Tax=Paracoccus sp. SY TaxID=1330255 RepID=UPI000CD06032|nr:rhamnan synthesis F family protein [Paracoccus sp. SY]